jgi:hypothetical protein
MSADSAAAAPMTLDAAISRLMSVSGAKVQRRFAVHGADEAPSRAHLVEGASFEDAALSFAEYLHPQNDADEMALLVEDCETGERQCFRIDLDTGAAGLCR